MKNPEISIIVPIYNTSNYLSECLNSIKCQTFDDFEVILIDDGSTDNSNDICNTFCRTDSRFKLFSKKNGGVASARNEGLVRASGKYIAWVDSDDTIDSTYIESMYQVANRTHNPVIVLQNKNTILDKQVIEGKEIIIDFLSGLFPSNMWSTLFLRNSYKGLQFKAYHIGEDSMMLIDLFSNINKISLIYNKGYNYRENPNSITRNKNPEITQSWINEVNEQNRIVASRFPYAQSIMSYKTVMFAFGIIGNNTDDYLCNQARDMIKKNRGGIKLHRLTKHQIFELVKALFRYYKKN